MRNEIVGCREFDVPHHFRTDRGAISNPISAMYRTADGRFLQLLMLDPDRDWPDLVARLDRADLLDDPRFASSDRRARHAGDCVKALEEVFSARPLDHWTSVLEGATGVWGAVQEPPELADDPQVVVNGYVRRVVDGHGREVMTITSPAQIDGEVAPTGPAPEWGEHTDEILTELGFGPEEISSLREDHVVR
jgi:formyl-CoA transferase